MKYYVFIYVTEQHCREDYLRVVEEIMYPTKICTSYGFNPSEGKFAIHSTTSLGFLLSPLRKPTVLEKWNPYEIALFESSISLYGKVFHQIQKVVSTAYFL